MSVGYYLSVATERKEDAVCLRLEGHLNAGASGRQSSAVQPGCLSPGGC